MWECPECHQKFIYENVRHSCNDKQLEDYLEGKSDHVIDLFNYFVEELLKIGPFALHPSKSRIAFAADIRFGYVHRLGKDFVDVVFQFRESFDDNFCFYKIANVPGSNVYNHYIRLKHKDDINEEVTKYMKLAYDIGKRKHIGR